MLSLSATQNEKVRNLIAMAQVTAVITFALLIFELCVFEPIKTNEFIYYNDHTGFHMSDFVVFYAGGQIIRSHERTKPYDPDVQLSFENALIAPNKLDHVFFFQSTPFFFLWVAALTLLPMKPAYVTWVILLSSAYIGAMLLFLRKCRGWSWPASLSCTFFVLLSYPVAASWKHGQPIFLAAAFLLLYLFAYEKKREFLAGLAIALCTFKPQYGLLLGLHSLCTQRWRIVIFAIISELILLGTAAGVMGWENIINYPKILHYAESSPQFAGVFPEYMISVRALLTHSMTQQEALNISSILWAVGALISGALIWGTAKLSEACRRWAFVVMLLLSIVLSAHTHGHDILLLSAAFALTRRSANESAPVNKFALIWSILLACYVPLTWLLHIPAVFMQFAKIPYLAMDCLLLALAALSLATEWRRSTADVEPV